MIDSKVLNYSNYKDPRDGRIKDFSKGESGELLFAESPDGAQYIVKHVYSHNAANEYVACWLAEKMRIMCPRAYLLTPNRIFRTHYAVAIEYIGGLETFDADGLSDVQKNDIISHFTLAQIVGTSDVVQMRKAGNRVFSYDFSEGFDISSTNVDLLLKDEDAGVDALRRCLSYYSRRSYFVDLPETAGLYNIPAELMKQGLISVGKRLLDITDDEVNAMLMELGNLYPLALSVYYEECIKTMRKKIADI